MNGKILRDPKDPTEFATSERLRCGRRALVLTGHVKHRDWLLFKVVMRKAAKAAGIDAERATHLTLRDLRQATATDSNEHTEDLAAAAYVSGHKDFRTTSRYAHARRRAPSRALAARAAARSRD